MEQSSSRPFLSVIIPAYNEERRIGKTLEAVAGYLLTKPWQSEVIVVSDGSTDKTVEVAQSFGVLHPFLRVIHNRDNHGKGYVVRQGMLEAKGELRLFTDADNATPIEELEKLLPHIKTSAAESQYDVVIGSIGLRESRVERAESIARVIAGKVGNLIIQTFAVPGIHDTQRGFKLFTAAAAEKIFPKARIDRWGFDVEALALARKFKFVVKEVAIRWIHDPESKVKASAYMQVLLEVFKIRWWLWTNY